MPGGVDIQRRSEFSLVQVRPGRFYPVLPPGVWAVSEFGLVQLRPGRFYPVLPPGVWGVSQREAAARRAPGLPGSETGIPGSGLRGSRLPGSRALGPARRPGSRAPGLQGWPAGEVCNGAAHRVKTGVPRRLKPRHPIFHMWRGQ